MNRVLSKNANRIKALEERLQDAEEQAIEASRRVGIDHKREINMSENGIASQVAKQLVRDRLAIAPSDHFSYSSIR
jgi:methylphosphotriester-DNA--protein-cysteine methyltransferase